MTVFVLDASVALSLIFEDESSSYSEAFADRLGESRAVAPFIWPLELVNSMVTAVRRGRGPGEDIPLLYGTMQRLRVEIDRGITPAHLARVTLNLGLAHRLSAYDASYLELAIRRGLPLATQDRRLREAASAAVVQFFQP